MFKPFIGLKPGLGQLWLACRTGFFYYWFVHPGDAESRAGDE
jgi:hypothetical protein